MDSGLDSNTSPPENPLSHLDQNGQAQMVDVGQKQATSRTARAAGRILFPKGVLEQIVDSNGPKGEVFGTARIAAIQAAKRTAELIPLCHPLRLDKIAVDFDVLPEQQVVIIEATVKATDRTGVEMEALQAVSTAALVIYDMSKALSKGIRIENIRLLEKTGGKSGDWSAD